MHVLNRLVDSLLLPPAAPWLLLLLALLVLPRHARLGQWLAWSSLLLGGLLMLPWSLSLLIHPLERTPVYQHSAHALAQPAGASALSRPAADLEAPQAIVVLGGGRNSHALEYGGQSINRLTLERLRYGVHLARQTHLPLLVSGGLGSADHVPEAQLMQRALREDFAWPARWVEDRSANTRQNARFSAAMLKQAGITRILLVTHAVHMPRARAYFQAAGLQVTPAPMGFFLRSAQPDAGPGWLPSAHWAYAAWYVLHEWAGLLQQRWLLRDVS